MLAKRSKTKIHFSLLALGSYFDGTLEFARGRSLPSVRPGALNPNGKLAAMYRKWTFLPFPIFECRNIAREVAAFTSVERVRGPSKMSKSGDYGSSFRCCRRR